MKKLLVVLLLGAVWAGKAEAAGPTRGAKGSIAMAYNVSGSSVATVAGPVAVYSVILSTGAVGDFVVLFDTGTNVGITSGLVNNGFKTRCFASTTTATSFCNYDPPLQFNLGLVAVNSTVANGALIVYEKGRVVNGY